MKEILGKITILEISKGLALLNPTTEKATALLLTSFPC